MIYKIVKRYFDLRIYTYENVGVFVKSGKISSDEFKEITGQDYVGV
ncbi:XkdX family protein [Anaerotignum sp.]|nr:XkdX family protein [Anaerotignum sp.]